MAFKDAGIWFVADGDEHAVQFDIFDAVAVGRGDTHPCNAHRVAQDFIQPVVPLDGDLALCFTGKEAILKDFLGL